MMQFSLSERQRRDLWGLALLALAILLALSLLPLAAAGEAALRLFPSGNVVGVIGGTIADVSWWVIGGVGILLPLLPAIWGAVALGRLATEVAVRWTLLLGGLLLLVPTGWYIVARPVVGPPPGAGWLGAAVGAPVTAWFGWVGALLLLTFLFAGLCIATLEWNPFRVVAGGGISAAAGLGRAFAVIPAGVGGRLSGWRARRAGRAGGTAADETYAGEHLPPEPDEEPQRLPAGVSQGAPWVPESVWPSEDDAHPVADHDATVADGPAYLGAPTVLEPAVAGGAPAAAAPPRERTRRRSETAAAAELVGEDELDPRAVDYPPAALLAPPPPLDVARSRRELDELGRVLIDKLATFKIPGEVVGMTTGPVVTQFEVTPAPGIKVARIASLEADLALAMRAPSIRIIAPIPGKGAVGVEVPNPAPEMVFFREVIESQAFRNSRALLPIALGKDIAGNPFVSDLAKAPHLLIAGATGSGKSVCVNTIITSLIYRHSPQTLRLLMVDPKMVELSMYNDLPHLRHPVVTDNNEAAGVLKWAVIEMERRYQLLSANGVRNLEDFNKRVNDGQVMRSPEADGEEGDPDRWIYKAGPLPYVVVIIDELADLMMTVQGEVEKPLALLAQKARAIGIHLILATQRPSVNVITGLIKANFPSRIAFRVSSKVDSRTILDQNGADSLLGNGDMLFLPPGRSDPVRLQGAFLSTEETERLMEWYREQARQRRDGGGSGGVDADVTRRAEEDILAIVRAAEADGGDGDEFDTAPEDRDKLFREAALLCIQHQGGSTSLLQRRLRIGYGRAARIIDQLHHTGILGPPDGSKSREVMVDIIGLDQICPE
jgi:DNA segregation ATPase FtsK/SpoIIIE, S-DNA-T family